MPSSREIFGSHGTNKQAAVHALHKPAWQNESISASRTQAPYPQFPTSTGITCLYAKSPAPCGETDQCRSAFHSRTMLNSVMASRRFALMMEFCQHQGITSPPAGCRGCFGYQLPLAAETEVCIGSYRVGRLTGRAKAQDALQALWMQSWIHHCSAMQNLPMPA